MENKPVVKKKSTSENPDLDWSQIRETIMMLHLAVSQIRRSMSDGEESIGSLTDSFTSMAGSASVIAAAGSQLPDSEEKEVVLRKTQEISGQMHNAISTFQFYDKLNQRLNHVCNSLDSLSELVGDPGKLFSPFEWRGLQEKIRSKYTSEGDKMMFDALLKGATVEEAINLSSSKEDPGEVELF